MIVWLNVRQNKVLVSQFTPFFHFIHFMIMYTVYVCTLHIAHPNIFFPWKMVIQKGWMVKCAGNNREHKCIVRRQSDDNLVSISWNRYLRHNLNEKHFHLLFFYIEYWICCRATCYSRIVTVGASQTRLRFPSQRLSPIDPFDYSFILILRLILFGSDIGHNEWIFEHETAVLFLKIWICDYHYVRFSLADDL